METIKNYAWSASLENRATGVTEHNKFFVLPTKCGFTAAGMIADEYHKETGDEWLIVFLNCLGESIDLSWEKEQE